MCYLFWHLKWANIHSIGGWIYYSKDDKCNSFRHIYSNVWTPYFTLPPPNKIKCKVMNRIQIISHHVTKYYVPRFVLAFLWIRYYQIPDFESSSLKNMLYVHKSKLDLMSWIYRLSMRVEGHLKCVCLCACMCVCF